MCLQTFIQKRRWMSETVFLELFSLSSCLPGPTSTQVSFALGAVKKGIPGGLLGGVLFQYPGLFMMAAIGVGAANFLQGEHWWSRAAVDGAHCTAPACAHTHRGTTYARNCDAHRMRISCCLVRALLSHVSSFGMG